MDSRHITIPIRPTRRLAAAAVGIAALVAAAACAPSSGTEQPGALPSASVDASFDLDALVAAAKTEGSVLVYDSTGDIKKVAEAFTAKYGIKAEGVKSDTQKTAEKLVREKEAGNVAVDLTLFSDGPLLAGELLPRQVVYTWLPPDLIKDIPETNRNPLLVLSKANVWVYNPKIYPNGCPVKNVWELTEDSWRGKVLLQDPLGKATIVQWLSQSAGHGAAPLADAYQRHTGKALQTTEKNAGWEWVKKLAKNKPIINSEDENIAAAVAAPQQTEGRIGLVSIAKFRDVEGKGYNMAVCEGLSPWVGFSYSKYVAIATGTKHPNAAKLFVHFVMTQEGIKHEMEEGGVSGSTAVPPSDGNPKGLTDWGTQLFAMDPKGLLDDYQNTQPVQDFWRVQHN
ncbi:ABC transporter substrate-binding protein [Micromonospora sp. NBC_01405]|uniref:ABC transporter substrate-binding protein n=1 Tax=Micromonospora sp. NBC_01405 TaxID=2903589 RepID=UPI003252E5AB